jgi:hypothetical protein
MAHFIPYSNTGVDFRLHRGPGNQMNFRQGEAHDNGNRPKPSETFPQVLFLSATAYTPLQALPRDFS